MVIKLEENGLQQESEEKKTNERKLGLWVPWAAKDGEKSINWMLWKSILNKFCKVV